MNGNQFVYEINNTDLDNETLMLNESLFHTANGYLGVRANYEEGYPADYDSIHGQYINGYYDTDKIEYGEKLYGFPEEKQTIINVVDTQGIRLSIAGEEFSMFDGKVISSSQQIDMERGFYQRSVHWLSPRGHELEIRIIRMASFTVLPLFLIDYRVKLINFTGEVKFISTHSGSVKNYCNPNDPRVSATAVQHIITQEAAFDSDVSVIRAKAAHSGLELTSAVKNRLYVPCKTERTVSGDVLTEELTAQAQAGDELRLLKYTVLCDERRYPTTRESALRILNEVTNTPVQELYDDQRSYLKKFWEKSYVEIDGNEELSVALCYSLYQLLQAVGKDSVSNIAAKGLSGEGYEGHYFWDTEIYMLPFFILTQRETAKSLISYRYALLPAARKQAELLGHKKGALYPWRTISGGECSGYFPSGSAQYHINGDIAYTVVAYYLMTKDIDFIAEKGAEIVFETARLWQDVGNYMDGSFHINDVTGPDEYTCLINDNYYTNSIAKYNLIWAVKFYRMLNEQNRTEIILKIGLQEEEVAEFQRAADHMYYTYDEKLDINPQDDSFLRKEKWDIAATPKENFPLLLHYHPLYIYRYQVCKQADTVLSHFLLEDEQKYTTIKNSYEYYEQLTTHDSSLSTCIFSIMASKLGMEEKAYDYFCQTSMLDIKNTHHNTKDGIHVASMGGTYMSILYGFAGFRLKESGIWFSPFLPNSWSGYRFQIHYEDSLICVRVTQNFCEFTLKSGTPKKLFIYEKAYLLKETLTVNCTGRE